MFCGAFALHLLDRNPTRFLPMDFGKKREIFCGFLFPHLLDRNRTGFLPMVLKNYDKIFEGGGKTYEANDGTKKKEPDFGPS